MAKPFQFTTKLKTQGHKGLRTAFVILPEQSATFGRKARLAAVLTVEENPAAPPLCPSLFTPKEYIDWKTLQLLNGQIKLNDRKL